MQKQMKSYVNKYLSPYLCSYRKIYNAQYALLAMIEKLYQSLDNKGIDVAILMDLFKAFDTINHELLIAKLGAYGFDENALAILLNYLLAKINTSFSTWIEILHGVTRVCTWTTAFNICINDLYVICVILRMIPH